MEKKENTKVTVVDSMMGSGKTSWAIDYINQHPDENFLYIAPYITETERIRDSVHREVKLPIHKGDGKIGNILHLLENEDDIASTHVLFTKFTDEHKDAIQRGNYTLFIDETLEAVSIYELKKKDDIKYLLDKGSIEIDSDGAIQWIDQDYDIQFEAIKILAQNHSLFRVNRKILVYQYPPDVFKLFKKVIILTYMFRASTMRYYFDLAKIEYNLKGVKRVNDEYKLVDYYESSRESLREKIHIYNGPDLNEIIPHQKITSFSSTWYKNPDNRSKITKLQRATYNYFHNKCKAKTGETMWTTFKNFKSKIKGKGYTNSFVPLNCRATNDYAKSKFLVYTANVYMNVGVSQFFSQRGMEIDNDKYALSELVQWIFRSAIRNGEDVHVFLPSKRMRGLLENWLNS